MARSTSRSLGGSCFSLSSSSSIAFCTSATVWPGRTVTSMMNELPSGPDCCVASTSWAICVS